MYITINGKRTYFAPADADGSIDGMAGIVAAAEEAGLPTPAEVEASKDVPSEETAEEPTSQPEASEPEGGDEGPEVNDMSDEVKAEIDDLKGQVANLEGVVQYQKAELSEAQNKAASLQYELDKAQASVESAEKVTKQLRPMAEHAIQTMAIALNKGPQVLGEMSHAEIANKGASLREEMKTTFPGGRVSADASEREEAADSENTAVSAKDAGLENL